MRDSWHWLRHRWGPWGEPYRKLLRETDHKIGGFWSHPIYLPRSEPMEWIETRQRRRCLTCGREEVRRD